VAENLSSRQYAVNRRRPDDRSESAKAFSELVVTVFRLEGALALAGDALAAPAGQTTARWRVLAAVEESPLSVAQIARAWNLARQSVQRVADVLERDGLVSYRDNPTHRRAKLVRLTPKGRSVLRRIQSAQRMWAEGVGRHLARKDLVRANLILDKVYQMVR